MKEIKNKYDSVGGWLAILCFLLIIVSPIRNIFGIYIEYIGTSPYFNEIEGLENYFYIEFISIIILMILSIWSGILLILLKPYAVKFTQIYLVLFLIYGIAQNIIPEISGLNEEFIKEIEYQTKVSTTSSILIFCIWFIYLSISKRVKYTYNKSNSLENLESNNQKYISNNKINLLFQNIRNFYRNQILNKLQEIVINNLSTDEIIIISIIIGTIFGVILGYYFGEYTPYPGNYNIEIFHFNYILGISGFIIFGGTSYIYIKRKKNS